MANRELSHYDESGKPKMVDVGGKETTTRRAKADGRIHVSAETFDAIAKRDFPKGDPFEIARIAGIAAAKKTADLIPLCHPLRLTFVDIEITPVPESGVLRVEATASAEERTGVEMEALVACTTALLTIYDMLKAIDKDMVISDVRLVEKTGGKSDYHADENPA